MKLWKRLTIVFGAGLATGFGIEGFIKHKQKEIDFYNGNVGYARAVYEKGALEKPDILEVYFNDRKSCPSGMDLMLPIAEVYNDYDHDGTIGNDPRDRYVVLFGRSFDENKTYSHKYLGDYSIINDVAGDCRRKYSTRTVHKKQEGYDDYHLKDATNNYKKYMQIIKENNSI